ncbi:class I SAM-dependent DNA methyltransferase [Brevibacillus migulae]|uniref:class I SAM-dependent DNA methyltransferase n=1 Tax=Brevibacillus migulae TaxID=1644114 RepID=UPI00106DE446|nr:class I SAM-dependent DNA methyltransferase [Brevibacillus migulae]
MITGELKTKIDNLWQIFWSGGITNPLTVIEQITYLLFIKGLEELEASVFSPEHDHLRWSMLMSRPPDERYALFSREVFPFIKQLHKHPESAYTRYMEDAQFMIPTPTMLDKVMKGISFIPMQDRDTTGDLYEYLLAKVATSGRNGQFRTPRHIVELMIDLTRPVPTDVIVDPAMGSAGFLVAASKYIKHTYPQQFRDSVFSYHFHHAMFHGFEIDRTMLRIGAMNMMLHGVDHPQIAYGNSLSAQNQEAERYTLILANPPFKGTLDEESVSSDLLRLTKTKKTELLFLALFLRLLKPGGRCAVIVPDGVLFGRSAAHHAIRKEIIEGHKLEAVISMPSGVFRPYAGVSTAILVFTKTNQGGTEEVWFYGMEQDGFSLDDKRTLQPASDIPDIIERFHHRAGEKSRKRTDQSFLVSVDELRRNQYDLSMNRYREVPHPGIELDEPQVIMERVKNLEAGILEGMKRLEKMLEK